ncbi:MAG: hypothetical protein IJA87_05515 [Clostridia bacterium]|nr:hypothetical protein [Clostridia bacterium]
MRRIKIIMLCIAAVLLLSSCAQNPVAVPEEDSGTTQPVTAESTCEETSAHPTQGTRTITVDGVVYRNNFQGDLILREFTYGREAVYSDSRGGYYRIDIEEYDLIYNVNRVEIGTGEDVYCRDDQWQELKDYYSDKNNVNYICITRKKNGEFKRHTADNMDTAKLNELTVFCDENSYEPFDFISKTDTRKISTEKLGDTEYRFIMNTNDELFSSGAASLYLSDGKLVLLHYERAAEKKAVVVDIPEELSDYFVSVIEKLNLI